MDFSAALTFPDKSSIHFYGKLLGVSVEFSSPEQCQSCKVKSA